ncbi:MAG: cytochrome bc complex cytochrome b subunit [Deltaproteobacteria bacterium]|nr:MAG: cytochrome bc complex cytochrome b subunit [Deltaproteobacteria bacterium]
MEGEKKYWQAVKENIRGWLSLEGARKNIEVRFGIDLSKLTDKIKSDLLNRPLPKNLIWIHYLGSVILLLFVIQVITGTALSFYYKPTPDEAHTSIKYIMNYVPYGWLIRSIHYWAANLMILSLLFHLARVYFMGAYKNPREFLWVSGVFNLGIIIAFGFTGYILPWDQISYWATTTLTSEIGDLPLIGKYIMLSIRGGEEVGSGTLTRFFVGHIMILPAALCSLILVHILVVARQGISPLWWKQKVTNPSHESQPRTFFPHASLDFAIIMFTLFALLMGLAVFFPTGLPDKANPLEIPAEIKPEWYLLFLYQFYRVLPVKILFIKRVVLFAIPFIIFIIVLFSVPFSDISEELHPLKRRLFTGLGTFALLFFLTFTLWGLFS